MWDLTWRESDCEELVGGYSQEIVFVYLSQTHPFDFVHVYDLDMQVSPQAFPVLHHLQQLALSVTDSSTEQVHTASSA